MKNNEAPGVANAHEKGQMQGVAAVAGGFGPHPMQKLTDEEYDVALALDMDAVRSMRSPAHPKYIRDEHTGKTYAY